MCFWYQAGFLTHIYKSPWLLQFQLINIQKKCSCAHIVQFTLADKETKEFCSLSIESNRTHLPNLQERQQVQVFPWTYFLLSRTLAKQAGFASTKVQQKGCQSEKVKKKNRLNASGRVTLLIEDVKPLGSAQIESGFKSHIYLRFHFL